MKKTSYRSEKQREKRKNFKPWSCWDVLAVQLLLCALLALAAYSGEKAELPWKGALTGWLTEVLKQEPIDLPDESQGQAVKEAIQTFLNQYIYEETEGMGGFYPVSEEQMEEKEAPEGTSFRPVTTEAALTAPLSGKITSPFGYRLHPITEKADFHRGIDIAAQEGTAVHAAADALVVEAGWSDIYGNYLLLEHSDGFQTMYAHCQRLIAQEGDVLRRGERIALVGSTGVSTGPHVHFEVIVEDQSCDPLWVLPL